MLCGAALLSSLPARAEIDAEAFARELERAAELNVSAPWPESQEILDRLRPHLGIATAEQYADFMLIEIRNLALAGRFDESLAKVRELLGRELTREQRFLAYTRGANIAQVARRFETGFRYLNRALAMLDREPIRDLGDELYGVAAIMYALVGEYDQAEDYARLALAIAEEREARDACVAHIRLGMTLMEAERWDEARNAHERALSACRAGNDELMFSAAEFRLGELSRRDGRHERAERLINSGLSGVERIGYATGIAEALLYRARLARDRGRLESVHERLAPAIEHFRDTRNWQRLAEAWALRAEAARAADRHEQALAHYDRYLEARERFFELSRNQQIAFLEVQFGREHATQELELLREQQRVRELRSVNRTQQRRLQIGLFVLLTLLVGVLVFLLVRATRDRRRFRSLSERDSLTALSNHTRFFDLAERTLALSREKGIPFTLILADIDHFKRVNDRYGHVAGDEVLRRVSARLRSHFGDRGIIGRIGGEEFGIALPGVTGREADRRLRAFRASLAEAREGDEPARVTLSFGVAEPIDAESLAALRARADQALYEAKRRGRNRTVHAPGAIPDGSGAP